jgi:predicted transposase YbfD/YdcC
VTSTLATHLASTWPGVAQVCRLTRQRELHGKQSIETVYAITSLTAAEATPARLLALARAHWGIENRLHYVRDVAWGEDQGRTRGGAAPQVLAALRNTALTLIRRRGFTPAEAFDHFSAYRHKAINAVRQGRTE